jgi:hypothetical protein
MNEVTAQPVSVGRTLAWLTALGLLGCCALAIALIEWIGMITKVDWHVIEDWSLAMASITQLCAPVALVSFAAGNWIGDRTDFGPLGRRGIVLAAVPLLVLPATFLLAWQPWVPYEEGVDKPSAVVWFGRIVELGTISALALLAVAYGFVARRPSIRGLIRMEAIAIPLAYALTYRWGLLAHPNRMREPVAPLIPLMVACLLAYLLTMPRRSSSRNPRRAES